MAKRKKKMKANEPLTIDAMDVWNATKPRYNAYMCGHGVHGNTKYSRKVKHRNRQEW